MATYEATNVMVARINKLDPENASKIVGHILFNLEDSDLVRLASSPDYVLHTLVLRIKTHLGLCSTPSSPSTHNHIPRPHINNNTTSNNLFSRLSGNPSSPSSHAWPVSGLPSNPISPKPNFSLSHEGIYGGSVSKSCLSPRVRSELVGVVGGGGDFVDEQQMGEYLSFLNESSPKDEDFVDPRVELGHGVVINNGGGGGDGHFHRRSYSASDVCFGGEELGIGYKPCLYFAKGFCKNGSNCKFVHHHGVGGGALADAVDGGGAAIVGSPSRFEGLEQHEEIMRLKAAQHHQRLMAASQLMAAAAAGASSPSSYDKYIHLLMQQQNDPQRAAAAAAVMMGDELCRFGRCRPERNDILGMLSADKPNFPSRQIYLTFPAESGFKDEDVSEYFSKFGPVQDVRIPYQQKRMFGFVTFVYPETVRLILSKGNPHFICDSRVLVKPYKEKGKIPDRRQQNQQHHLERGEFSPCLSPSGLDSKPPHDFRLGVRMFYNQQEIMMRRKLEEEQAELQQAIELQERRLMNLHLPDFKNNHLRHHQRSLSIGASLPLSQFHGHVGSPGLYPDSTGGDITGFGGNLVSTMSSAAAADLQQSQQEVDSAGICDSYGRTRKGSALAEITDLRNSAENALPDSLSASPTKAAGDNLSDFSALAHEINETAVFSTCSSSQNKFEQQSTLSDMASH